MYIFNWKGRSIAVLAVAVLSGVPASAQKPGIPTDGALKPILETTVCPWTPTNPRHDHQMIFPLKGDRLMLVWCEYYATRPSQAQRKPTDRKGGFGDDMPCRISAKISTDNARTWGPKFVLQDNRWYKNVKHPNLIRLPSGEILFTFTGWESDEQRNIFMKRSSDECETWSDIVQISAPGWYCTNHGRMLRLESGRILLPAHGVLGGGPYRGAKSKLCSWVWYSDDGFRTWAKSNEMTAPGRGAHEPTIVELKDGRLLCFLRTTTGRIWRSFSKDQGQTWSEPETTDLPAPDSEALLKRIPSTGDLLLLWNNVESKSNWPRTPLCAAISKDEGKTWGHLKNVDSRSDYDAAYPSAFFQDDEAIIMYYTRKTKEWGRDSEITLKIFRIDEFYR
jgi:sialidase-1